MITRVSATQAKNNFGAMLDEVASLDRVDVVRHGRTVAIVLSPRGYEALAKRAGRAGGARPPRMIPRALARAARVVSEPPDFDDDWGESARRPSRP